MRSLRYILRLTFALEAVGFISLAFFAARSSKLIASAGTRHHLARFLFVEILIFLVMAGCTAAIAAWRIERGGGDRLGRWSLLAASIFNLALFPVGTCLAALGIFYFVRNPSIDPTLDRKHQPIVGDGTGKWSGVIFTLAQLAWGIFILSSIRRWTIARGMHPIHSEALFWITLACAVYGSILVHELGHFVFGDIVGFRLIGCGVVGAIAVWPPNSLS